MRELLPGRTCIPEIRPDWDLTVPGLRENWKAGDHSMHHSYQAA